MSDLKINASRKNGKKSEGPITPEGRARSSSNAIKNGIFSQKRFIEGEDPAEYAMLLEQLARDLNAEGLLEYFFVDEMAMAMWRKRRLNQAEAAAIGKSRANFTFGYSELKWDELSTAFAIRVDKFSEQDQKVLEALRDDLAFRSRSLPADDEKFNRVAVSLDRSLERAFRGLRAAQQLRRESKEAIIVQARAPVAGRQKSGEEFYDEEVIAG